MKIDSVSINLIQAALYLDSKVPGSVSEIWIGEELVEELKSSLPKEIDQHIKATKEKIREVLDKRRKKYLEEIMVSIEFQINTLNKKPSYSEFSMYTFGYEIGRVTEDDLTIIENEIQIRERVLGKTRYNFFKAHQIDSDDYQSIFETEVLDAKEQLPKYITEFKDKGFIFETTTNKPWSAFNSHIAPYTSKLTINADLDFSQFDLIRLAYHEAYGGHHAELSQKDKLLIEEGRGEHGFVLTFSPQTFMSEAIAESIFYLLGMIDTDNPEQMLTWSYDRLLFALHNVATYMFFDDGKTRTEIDTVLSKFEITDKARKAILNFSTDPVFAKYAPVYYSAFNFLTNIYDKTNTKEKLIKTLFTQPCTPDLLSNEFIQ